MKKSSPRASQSRNRCKKGPSKAEAQQLYELWAKQLTLKQRLGVLAQTPAPGSLGFSYRMPTTREREKAVQEDPEKGLHFVSLSEELIKVEQAYAQMREQVLQGLRQKDSTLFFVPFACLAEVLLEDPAIRGEVWQLRQARWNDPEARRCLKELGRAMAWADGRPSQITLYIADRIREIYPKELKFWQAFKCASRTLTFRSAQKRHEYLAVLFDLPREEVAALVEELRHKSPSEVAAEQTAKQMKVSIDMVYEVLSPSKRSKAKKPTQSQ